MHLYRLVRLRAPARGSLARACGRAAAGGVPKPRAEGSNTKCVTIMRCVGNGDVGVPRMVCGRNRAVGLHTVSLSATFSPSDAMLCPSHGQPLLADSVVQPCAENLRELDAESSQASSASASIASSSSSSAALASLTDRCMGDVAPYVIHEAKTKPILHTKLPPRTAVVTLAHRARNTTRFLSGAQAHHATDVVPCAVIVQALALREIGGFHEQSGVDLVLLHSQLLPEELEMIAAHGIKTYATNSLPDTGLYGSEFEAANMLKVDVAALTGYDRVLYVDLDMLPRERVEQHLLLEYAEDLVSFPGPSAPVSGQLFVLRPNVRMHTHLRRLTDTRNFSVARGWGQVGLLTWPDRVDLADSRAQCNASYAKRGLHVAPGKRRRHACSLSPFWMERCRKFGLTNWNFMHAGSDQGILWYAYNLSGLGSVRSIVGKPVVDGRSILFGRQFWTHLQGMCKPWLVSRSALTRAKCLKTGAYFWHGIWRRLRAKHDLDRKCPTFSRAFDKFVSIAPREAEMPCFWSERCFQKYKPKWVVGT